MFHHHLLQHITMTGRQNVASSNVLSLYEIKYNPRLPNNQLSKIVDTDQGIDLE